MSPQEYYNYVMECIEPAIIVIQDESKDGNNITYDYEKLASILGYNSKSTAYNDLLKWYIHEHHVREYEEGKYALNKQMLLYTFTMLPCKMSLLAIMSMPSATPNVIKKIIEDDNNVDI